MGDGPQRLSEGCEAAVAALVAALPVCATSGSRAEWAAAIGAVQQVVNVAVAVQDAAIARLAAIEPQWCEDGTEVESHRGLGHVALDAPAVLSGVLGVSAVHAERRTAAAVALAADGPTGSATQTGLGGLHAAMTAGVLDAYRAAVVAAELEHAPAAVAEAVVAALAPHFGREDGAHLRRRCRRVLARVSPDLLRQRAVRARTECGLRRWAQEPGVDRWEGTFPSEDAAQAWAAIDALARRYVAEQGCASIERARAQALTDLVAGNATITTVLTLTVPATVLPDPAAASQREPHPPAASGPEARPEPHPPAASEPEARPEPPEEPAPVGDGDLVEVTGAHGSQPVLVSRAWLTATAGDPRALERVSCHPRTGAVLDEQPEQQPEQQQAERADTIDAVAEPDARIPDPVGAGTEPDDPGTGPGPGTSNGDTDHPPRPVAPAGAHRYRPPARLAQLVRARDRRCRFPGCTVAAVFCDLDHVRPWPAGPTTAENLMCLCRRHHRVKQRPGWRVALAPDATATWTDPTGRVRTTDPADALRATVLPERPTGCDRPGGTGTDGSPSRPRTLVPDGPHSELEFLLEHLGTAPPGPPATRHDGHRRPRPELVPLRRRLVLAPTHHRPRRPRSTGPCHDVDPPPF